MKSKDVRELSVEELQQREKRLEEDLFRLRFRNTAGQLESSASLGKTRRNIALIKTILREKGVQ
ncbi:MAG: 50S ribosomal protein L29 [Syntrophales bacterium]|jgi:large subunit ribosomal protein L29|nr:50S ribosomal protein L29 [Syntrophales bacterium]MCK9527870.1 50S ribosomal protein L29 [Syntrophales bacterium]MDX9921956.1 50S ribosomal protein L29 [Syntrophales bacterium]